MYIQIEKGMEGLKKYLLVLSLALLVLMAACGNSEETPKEVSKVEKESNGSENNDTEEVEEESYNEVLIDSDITTITLEGISNVTDDIFGDSHVIKVSIENKSDDTIVIQTDQVSVDGLMVTDNVFFSEEVAAGKKANGKIEIQVFDDEELPPLDEELEMILKVISEETYETIEEEKINIEIK